MAYLCPHQCDGKTEYGYCRYTWCVNPLHSNFGTAQQGQGVQIAVITNGDCVRSMSDEELAVLFKDHFCPMLLGADMDCQNSCEKCWLDWLKQEASE